jgi:tetratricopeptide (TPR) repeat protein
MSLNKEPDFDLEGAVAAILAALAEARMEEALAEIDALSKRLGGAPIVFHLVGLASLRLNEPGKAVEAFLAAHQAEPDLREYSDALSIVMSHVGRLVDSLYYQKLSIAATRHSPIPGLIPDWVGNFAEAFRSIAEAPLMKAAEAAYVRGDYAGAAALFRKESEVAPDSAAALRGLAQSLLLDNKPLKSVEAAEHLVALDGAEPRDLALLGRCLAQAGRTDEAVAMHRRAEALRPDDPDLAWAGVVTAAQHAGRDLAVPTQLMIGWGKRFAAPPRPRVPVTPAELDRRRLRLGIVSAHWLPGDGLDALVPPLELLDRRRIELFCYASGQVDAALAVRIRQRANSWCDLRDLDDATAGVVLGNDALDVLIDLDGPIRCRHPLLFAARPARLSLTAYGLAEAAPFLGFDGVIGDALAYPAGSPGLVLRIPGGLASLPDNLAPLDRPARGDRPVVFGTLAYRWQIGPETASAWAAILAAAPDATLVLNAQRLGGLDAVHDLATRFSSLLPPERVLSVDCGNALTDYLLSVDALLDPPDNPQPDEALAALMLGVPVLTCRSPVPRAALLATWLETAGLADFAAASPQAYIAVGASLAEPSTRQAMTERAAAAVAAELPVGAARQAARLGAAIQAAALGIDR